MTFSRGQRAGIRIAAFALRRGADLILVQRAVYRVFGGRHGDLVMSAMWHAVLDRGR